MNQDVFATALESYFDDWAKGTEPAGQALIDGCPNHADKLREFYSDLGSLRAFRDRMRDADGSGPGSRANEMDSGGSGAAAAPDACLPIEVGSYRLLEKVGRGRQGLVFKAQHIGTERIVALKIIRGGLFASRSERMRFENEAPLAGRLRHPNIIEILDSGRDRGLDFVAMEFVEGRPLDRYCFGEFLGADALVRLHLQVCRAISFAHQHGVLHRDLKPTNVLVDGHGCAHVLDFGLAKPLTDAAGRNGSSLTQLGDFAGTLHYASPEQVRRDPRLVDVRTDVYALGVMLYEMLTGCYPYPIRNLPSELIERHILHTPPLPPSKILRDLGHDLETIVLRALCKEPDRRYQSAAALADDLERYLAGQPIEAKRDHLGYVAWRLARRHRAKLLAGAAVIACLAATVLKVTAHVARTEGRVSAARQTNLHYLERTREWVNDDYELLGDLYRAERALHAIAAAHPELPEVQHALKQVDPELDDLMADLVQGLPDQPMDLILTPDHPDYSFAQQWLEANRSNLEALVEVLSERRPGFGMAPVSGSGPVHLPYPLGLGEATKTTFALLALGDQQLEQGSLRAAVTSFDAAREVAVSLGDGPHVFHKSRSVEIHRKIHEQCLTLLSNSQVNSREYPLLLNWIAVDPPMADYNLAAVAYRIAMRRVIDGGCLVSSAQAEPHLDLGALNVMMDGLYSDIGSMTEKNRQLAASTTPQEVTTILDFYVDTIRNWDRIPAADLDGEIQRVLDAFSQMRAYPVVRPFQGGFAEGFRFRGQSLSVRQASLVAAELCRFRLIRGDWPRTVAEALSEGQSRLAIDPYLDEPFGYAFVDGYPVLYSLNKDRHDDGGLAGEWDQEGTDVVLFRPRW
jgi:hypothetical protein